MSQQITFSEIQALILPGDVIAVEYLRTDLVATGISLAEGGKATHALCCLGALGIVEADLSGVSETSLRNYLRGNCKLTVRSAKPAPFTDEAKKATEFWLARVNDPYDTKMILGEGILLVADRLVGLFSEKASAWMLRKVPNVFASKTLSTCAELAARGLWQFSLLAMREYPAGNITPELLRTDDTLLTKAVLDGAVLVG